MHARSRRALQLPLAILLNHQSLALAAFHFLQADIVSAALKDQNSRQPEHWKGSGKGALIDMAIDATFKTTEALERKDEEQQAEHAELRAELAEPRDDFAS